MIPDIEHIFDANACLTRRQIKDYISAVMPAEEIETVEHHFSTCPLCREAMDGYLAHSDKALETLTSLDTHFLKDQIGAIQQQLPARPVPVLTKPAPRRRRLGRSPGFNAIVPLFLIAGMFALFQHELRKPIPHQALTQAIEPTAAHAAPVHRELMEAKTEPGPTIRRLPEAPVGHNLKMLTVSAPSPADTATVRAITAPKITTQPTAARSAGTTPAAPGAPSVTASYGTPAKTESKPIAPANVPPPAKHVAAMGPNDDFFDEPDVKPAKPAGSAMDGAAAPPPGRPAEKPKSDTARH